MAQKTFLLSSPRSTSQNHQPEQRKEMKAPRALRERGSPPSGATSVSEVKGVSEPPLLAAVSEMISRVTSCYFFLIL